MRIYLKPEHGLPDCWDCPFEDCAKCRGEVKS